MAIIINIDVMLAKRKMSVTELAEKVGITMANLSILKNGKAKAIRLSTLEAICRALVCQPGDILEYRAYAKSTLPSKTSALNRRSIIGTSTAQCAASPTSSLLVKNIPVGFLPVRLRPPVLNEIVPSCVSRKYERKISNG